MGRRIVKIGNLLICSLFLITCNQSSPLFTPKKSKPNILLITIDTLRPDHLGCYGYQATKENQISPNLDKLAQEGFRFEKCFVQCPITLPSHTSILTGLNPTTHNVRDNLYYALAPKFETLAEILKAQGYDTAAILGAEPLKRSSREGYGLSQGFDLYDDHFQNEEEEFVVFFPERTADEVTNLALDYLKKRGKPKNPFFLWVHYFDPHANYKPPAIHNKFKSTRGEKYDAYAGEINFTDFEIGRLLKKIDTTKTITVVTADHGEGLGEHDEESHGAFLFDSTLHVPLIMQWKNNIIPGSTDLQVNSIDITPTILSLAQISRENKKNLKMEGNSLASLLQQKWDSPPERPSYGETFYCFQNFNWKVQRSLRTPEKKYIEGLENKGILFDLKNDPAEEKPKKEDPNLASMAIHLKEIISLEAKYTSDYQVDLKSLEGGGYWNMPPAPLKEDLKNPDSSLTLLLKEMNTALTLAHTGNYKASLKNCEEILQKDPTNVAMLNLKVKLLSSPHVQQYRAGVKIFEQLRELRPELTKTCTHGIINNYIKLKKFESAKIELENLAILEKQGELKRDYQTFNFLAFLLLEEGLTKQALKALDFSAQDNPENPICEYYRSQAYFRLGRFDEGIEALNQCLANNENFIQGIQAKEAYIQEILKKGIKSISKKQFAAAELLFQQSLKLGETTHSRYYLALTFLKNNKKAAATEILTQLLKSHPYYYDAYFYLGYLHLDAKRLEEGTLYLQQAITHFKNCYEDHRQEMVNMLQEIMKNHPEHELTGKWNYLINVIPR